MLTDGNRAGVCCMMLHTVVIAVSRWFKRLAGQESTITKAATKAKWFGAAACAIMLRTTLRTCGF